MGGVAGLQAVEEAAESSAAAATRAGGRHLGCSVVMLSALALLALASCWRAGSDPGEAGPDDEGATREMK